MSESLYGIDGENSPYGELVMHECRSTRTFPDNHYLAHQPPSMRISVPVMKPAASEQR